MKDGTPLALTFYPSEMGRNFAMVEITYKRKKLIRGAGAKSLDAKLPCKNIIGIYGQVFYEGLPFFCSLIFKIGL
ncbi:hypothetical protein [Bacillus atrophaeus]|uniref:hypothetical protein n=1 Tax=Bacillus atrophaeus TaxID=1452 RepID=UPI0012FE3C2A|nr:hypothetical protein [Bacillus atrophaeus]